MLERLKTDFYRKLADEARVWGVTFESSFPAEFIVSKHAEDRFKERSNISPAKIMKMTVKAWQSEMEIPKMNYLEYRAKYSHNGYPPQFRFYMGYLFVFQCI